MRTSHVPALPVAPAGALVLGGPSAADAGRRARHGVRARGPRWAQSVGGGPDSPCEGPFGPDDPPPPGCGGTAGTTASTSGSTSSTAGTTSTAAGTTSTAGGTAGTGGGGGTGGDPPPPPPPPTTGGGESGSSAGATAGSSAGTSAGTSAGGTAGSSAGSTGGDGVDDSGGDVTVDGAQDGGYVSGTNVNAPFTLRIRRTADSTWTDVSFDSADVAIGGAYDSHLPNRPIGIIVPLPAVGDSAYCPLKVRFASTHFADNATLPLDAAFHYRLKNGSTYSGVHTKALPTFHAVVYNKGLTIGTQQDFDPAVNQYVAGDPNNTNGYSYQSQVGAQAAASNLYAINHALEANGHNPSNVILGRSAILAALKRTTAFFGFTHGEPDGFLASYVQAAANDIGGDKLFFAGGAASEVGVATLSGRSVPLPNIMMLHACSTVQPGAVRGTYLSDASDALGVTSNHQTLTDRAYAGFPGTLWSLGAQQAGTMGQHAGAVYQKVIGGWTIQKAVKYANDTYQPKDNANNELPMQVLGDPYARLKNAYTGALSTDSDLWYLFP